MWVDSNAKPSSVAEWLDGLQRQSVVLYVPFDKTILLKGFLYTGLYVHTQKKNDQLLIVVLCELLAWNHSLDFISFFFLRCNHCSKDQYEF